MWSWKSTSNAVAVQVEGYTVCGVHKLDDNHRCILAVVLTCFCNSEYDFCNHGVSETVKMFRLDKSMVKGLRGMWMENTGKCHPKSIVRIA